WNGTAWSVVASPDPADDGFATLTAVTCTSAANCFAVGEYELPSPNLGLHQSLIEHWDGTSWSILPAPLSAPTASELNGVTCATAPVCAAVGGKPPVDAPETLVAHWDGTSWSEVSTPTPAGADDSRLRDVSCTSATACIAVGSSSTGLGPMK